MPSPKNSQQLKLLTETVAHALSLVLTDHSGLPVTAQSQLRAKVKAAGGQFKVAKNNLLKLALGAKVKPLPQSLLEALKGPTAVLFGLQDPIGPLKELVAFSKDHDLPKIKLGLMEGKLLTPEDIARLSTLPSRQELLQHLIIKLKANQFSLVLTLKATLTQLVFALKNLETKKATVN